MNPDPPHLRATTVAWTFVGDGTTSARHHVVVGPGHGFRVLCGAEIMRTPPTTVEFDAALPVTCAACLGLLLRETGRA